LHGILQLGPYIFGGHLVSHLTPYVPAGHEHLNEPDVVPAVQVPPFKHVLLRHLTIVLHGGLPNPGGQQQ